jgi:hypothetical protein
MLASAAPAPPILPTALEPLDADVRAALCDPKATCPYWAGSLTVWRDRVGKVALVFRSVSCPHHPNVGYLDGRGTPVLGLPHTVERCPKELPDWRVRERELTRGLVFYETIDCKGAFEAGKVPKIEGFVSVEQLARATGDDAVLVVDARIVSITPCPPPPDSRSPELVAPSPSACACSVLSIVDAQHPDGSAGASAILAYGPQQARAGGRYRMRLVKRGGLELVQLAELD